MRFDTVTFWLFFVVSWATWRYLPFAWAKTSALVASLIFYGWWNPAYLILLAAPTLIDWQAGLHISRSQSPRVRRAWLLFSLTTNLGLLGTFKYLPFLAQNATAAGHVLGFDPHFDLTGWVIPVGISFYTFQTMSYVIDIYRGHLLPARSLRDFALFVTFFPQLVAGPIVRASDLIPQLERRRSLAPAMVQAGLYHCITGLFLKMVIADNLAPEVERIFAAGSWERLPPLEAWLGALYFSVQIYADFAGYSGIAIGLAYLLGLRFPENFRYPFLARGPAEFWRRWHISLSTWLRDYLYVPLGGNRRGRARTYFNLLITMLLGGLWHGAAWTFVLWGLLHGLALSAERILRGDRRSADAVQHDGSLVGALRSTVAWLAFFLFLLVTWVPFRAPTIALAGDMLERMLVAPWSEPMGWEVLGRARYLVLVLPIALAHLLQLRRERGAPVESPRLQALAAACMLFLLCIVARRESSAFLYFQF